MKRFNFNLRTILSEETLKEVRDLREIIMKDLGTLISMQDAYLLWTCIHDDFYEGMLVVPTGLLKEEYIEEKMREYGTIIKGV